MKKNTENETLAEAKQRRKKGSQGKAIEDKVHKALNEIKIAHTNFDFDRLLDARAAGRPVPPTVADFTFVCDGQAGALEVKSTKHEYRLAYGDFPQFPKLRRRAQAGALCLVAVYHSTIKVWRVVDVATLPLIDKGSFDLREYPSVPEFKAAFIEILEDSE